MLDAYLVHSKSDSQNSSSQLALHHAHVVTPCCCLGLIGDCQGVGNHKYSALREYHIRCSNLQVFGTPGVCDEPTDGIQCSAVQCSAVQCSAVQCNLS